MTYPHRHTDITVRGQVFPDTRAVAKHFGIHTATVCLAIRAGKLDTLGFGRGWNVAMPVRVRDMVFPSAKAAADHFGMSPKSITSAIRRGNIDRIGLPRSYVGPGAKPVMIAGLSFPSQAAASRALGLCATFIAHYKRKRLPASRETLMRAVGLYKARLEAEAAANPPTPELKQPKQVAGQPARAGAGCKISRAA